LVCVPMMMPTYLAYAGWSVLRQPGTALGDLIARLDPSIIVFLDQSLGIIGLALWAWPLSTLILAPGFARLDQDHADAMSLDGASGPRRLLMTAMLLRGSLFTSILAIALIAIGSSVPLHLAQVRTLAIQLWAMLGTQSAESVWLMAWPLVLVSTCGAWLITRILMTLDEQPRAIARPTPPRHADVVLLALAVSLSVVLPIVLFAFGLKRWSSVTAFARGDGSALGASLTTGAIVGIVIASLALASHIIASGATPARRLGGWGRRGGWGWGGGPRVIVQICLGAFCVAAIVPGVLIGAAVNSLIATLGSVPALEPLADWLAAGGGLVIAHAARFGFLGIAVGWIIGRSEAQELRETRALAGGSAARAWWLTAGRAILVGAIGIGLAGMAMSVQEIESTVILSPPGQRGVAVAMLEHLHYNAQEQLMAAGLTISAGSLALALLASALLSKASVRPPASHTPPV
ncbi:MAG: hypothetical protein K2X32_06100, partial [Phycisphaerales bacterium]|nr:hypothetical protein [Phycisphaerales bacterium]